MSKLKYEDIKVIVDKYYKREKSGLFTGGKTYCFCGEIYEDKKECSVCGGNDIATVSKSGTMGNRTNVVQNSEDSIRIQNLKFKVTIADEELCVKEIESNYISINGFKVRNDINGSSPKSYKEDVIRELIKFNADLEGVVDITTHHYSLNNQISQTLEISKNFPILKGLESDRQIVLLNALKILKIKEYDEDKTIDEILGIHPSFVDLLSHWNIRSFQDITAKTTDNDVKKVLSHIRDMNNIFDLGFRMNSDERLLMKVFERIEDVGDVDDLLEVAEKSQRHYTEISIGIIVDYCLQYKQIYKDFYDLKNGKAITNKDVRKLRLTNRLVNKDLHQARNVPFGSPQLEEVEKPKGIEVNVEDVEKLLNMANSNPLKALKQIAKIRPS